jgi:hypothetical protein
MRLANANAKASGSLNSSKSNSGKARGDAVVTWSGLIESSAFGGIKLHLHWGGFNTEEVTLSGGWC